MRSRMREQFEKLRYAAAFVLNYFGLLACLEQLLCLSNTHVRCHKKENRADCGV